MLNEANASSIAAEVDATETPQAKNSQENSPETTRAGAVTNLRDLPGAHPYCSLHERKNEDNNNTQLADIQAEAVKYYKVFKDVVESDGVKRFGQLLALLPKNFTESILKSDGFWEILTAIEKTGLKGYNFTSKVLDGLAKYEKMGKFGEKVSKGFKWLENFASPFEAGAKAILEKVAGIKPLSDFVTKGGELVGSLGKVVGKFAAKAATVLTFAELGITAVSSGVAEYCETGDIGKAVGKGALSAIASVGPLEGATIGSAIGGVPGACIGAGVGLIVQGIKFVEPKFFDDPVQGTKNIMNKIGRGIQGAANTVSSVFSGLGKALGFAS